MIREKTVSIDVDVSDIPKKKDEVFYNPKMEINRDISVACLDVFSRMVEKDLTVCEPLAGSGVRALRYLKEIEGISDVFVNDLNPGAIRSLEKNIEENKITGKTISVSQKDAKMVLLEHKHWFHNVDIDPFGSPIYFIDSAATSLKKLSSISATATDLAVLCGTYKKTCMRRYSSIPLRTSYCHEIGLRILIKAIFEKLSPYDLSFEPLMSFYDQHYFRVFGKVVESAKRANRGLEKIGWLNHCQKCHFRKLDLKKVQKCENCGGKVSCAGPLWISTTSEKRFVSEVHNNLAIRGYLKAAELSKLVLDECLIDVPFYHLHDLAKFKKSECTPRDNLIKKIQKVGYSCSRTHFSPLGIRTNCPIDQIYELV